MAPLQLPPPSHRRRPLSLREQLNESARTYLRLLPTTPGATYSYGDLIQRINTVMQDPSGMVAEEQEAQIIFLENYIAVLEAQQKTSGATGGNQQMTIDSMRAVLLHIGGMPARFT